MTTTEKLQRIKSRCGELLALAERRTPGEWQSVDCGNGAFLVLADGCTICMRGEWNEASTANGRLIYYMASAEAGWRATIAAIRFLQNTDETGEGIETLNAILAAWEGLV